MKIAQIVCAYPPYAGGIGQSAKRFADILSTEHQLSTFTLKPKMELTENSLEVTYLNPRLRYGHGGLPFSLLFKLRHFDCLFLHYPFFGAAEIVYFFLLFFPKKKLIIHYHMDTANLAWFLKPLAWPSKLIKNLLFSRAEKISVASLDYLENSPIKKLLKKYPEKFIEIPFGLDTNLYTPKIPNSENKIILQTKKIINFVTHNFIKRGQVNLLFVGGLDSAHYFKGLLVLFEALNKLEYQHWHLDIVGSGNLEEFYQTQSRNLGLAKKIKFLGRLSEADLIRAYQAADIFILPSINSHEAFGLVLMEAMACGTPVIASNLPGVRRVFRDGLDGLLSEAGNAPDLAVKLADLIGNEPKRNAMAKSARTYAVTKYSLEQVSEQLKQLFV